MCRQRHRITSYNVCYTKLLRKKVIEKNFDAIVLALAGLSRLGIDVNYSILSTDDFSPSPGQGALAIVSRSDDENLIPLLKKIEDQNSRLEIEAERALSDYVDSGCRFPIGAYAKSDGDSLVLEVSAFSVDGKNSINVVITSYSIHYTKLYESPSDFA